MTINLSDEAVIIIRDALELLLAQEYPTRSYDLDDERTDTLLTLCNTFDMEAQEISELSPMGFSDDATEYEGERGGLPII